MFHSLKNVAFYPDLKKTYTFKYLSIIFSGLVRHFRVFSPGLACDAQIYLENKSLKNLFMIIIFNINIIDNFL